MADDVYYRLRDILDKMPNGYPSTDDGLEIKILKKIFTEEEAEVATKMRMKFETAEAMAARTGLDVEYLKKMLPQMANNGQIFGVTIGGAKIYKLAPFVFGVYEWQVYRLDRELVDLCEEYFERGFGEYFWSKTPALTKVVPVEQEIPAGSVVEPYESITGLIEKAKSWAVGDCICKKEKMILGEKCDNPMEVCMALSPIENMFEGYFWGRPITKEEAYAVLKKAEDSGLVHMISNTKEGHIFICNCCGCCCGILRGVNQLGLDSAMARSNYRAVVDENLCTACGACRDRCQVKGVIEIGGTAMISDRCIGCGLCVSSCPLEAIKMTRKEDADIEYVPIDEKEWNKKRAEGRGRDDYKELLK
ncbi:MAG: 4Fe-4S binding protein [Spirochaetes bacterium]|nr:4Fe-4S binding protein [Spirochaetota bacterium]